MIKFPCIFLFLAVLGKPAFSENIGLNFIISQYKTDRLAQPFQAYPNFIKSLLVRKDNGYGTDIVDYLIRDSDIVGKAQLNATGGIKIVYRVSYYQYENKPYRTIYSYTIDCADSTQIDWIKYFNLTDATEKLIWEKQSTKTEENAKIWQLACFSS